MAQPAPASQLCHCIEIAHFLLQFNFRCVRASAILDSPHPPSFTPRHVPIPNSNPPIIIKAPSSLTSPPPYLGQGGTLPKLRLDFSTLQQHLSTSLHHGRTTLNKTSFLHTRGARPLFKKRKKEKKNTKQPENTMSDAATAAQTAPAAQKSDDAKDAGSKSPASPVATTDGKTDADGASDDKTDATPAADADKKSTEGKYRFLCL